MLKQLKQVHVSGSHFLINKGSQSNKRNEILFMRFVRQTNQIARVPACCSQNQSCLLVFACGFCFVSLMFFDYLSSSELQSQVFYLRNTSIMSEIWPSSVWISENTVPSQFDQRFMAYQNKINFLFLFFLFQQRKDIKAGKPPRDFLWVTTPYAVCSDLWCDCSFTVLSHNIVCWSFHNFASHFFFQNKHELPFEI